MKTVTRLTRTRNVPLLISRTRNPRFTFRPTLPHATLSRNTSLIIRSARGILSTLDRTSVLRIRKPHVSHSQLRTTLRLARSADPDCLLLTSLSTTHRRVTARNGTLLDRAISLTLNLQRRLTTVSNLQIVSPTRVTTRPDLRTLSLAHVAISMSKLKVAKLRTSRVLRSACKIATRLPRLHRLALVIDLNGARTSERHYMRNFQRLMSRKTSPTPARVTSTRPDLPRPDLPRTRTVRTT